ncbi:MAG: ATP-binding protein [Planctomycetes bacterium]|nr:ATP-binding protein [Planctomycetota bacterium]
MPLPFLNRTAELDRLRDGLAGDQPGLVCVYGRRRLGKSALLRELLTTLPGPYFVGDARSASEHRRALAEEIGRHLPGFAGPEYRDWDALLTQWWHQAPPRLPLLLDEFPLLVTSAPELPSLLQKHLDRQPRPVLLCGSSQSLMQGLVLDATAPLYGRARQILHLQPLELPWIRPALRLRTAAAAVEHWAVWGGVPRYWELATGYRSLFAAISGLALDPNAVLHHEPERLLRDDAQDPAAAATLLSLVGRGCHRLSEIAARIQRPATSLSRPLARLIDLGLLARDVPFGRSTRDTKRTRYRVADPFLAFWFRFVEPARSRLAAGQLDLVLAEVKRQWPQYLGQAFEQVVRDSVPRLTIAGRRWGPAVAWWGQTADGQPLEIDLVATSVQDHDQLLVGEVKLAATASELHAAAERLRALAPRCPELAGKQLHFAMFVLRGPAKEPAVTVVTAEQVVGRPPANTPRRKGRR